MRLSVSTAPGTSPSVEKSTATKFGRRPRTFAHRRARRTIARRPFTTAAALRLGAARVMNAYRGDLALTWSWYLGTVLFFAIGIALVVTYSRLRRPHPIVVRVVIAATVLMPAILWIYDTAAANVGAR